MSSDPNAPPHIPVANPPVNPNVFVPITPGPAPKWWPTAGPMALQLETAMGVRVHPPFTHLHYLNTVANFHQTMASQAARTANSTLALLFVLNTIDVAKTDGAGIGANAFYNMHRNLFG